MSDSPATDRLHGVTLKVIVEYLIAHYGFPTLGELVPIRCFQIDPSLSSSLKFLRRTPWARAKVESLYLATVAEENAR